MARFYQHLEPNDLMGKVTKLLYIDDIHDDEMIIYYFADKTKCNEDYIAALNDANAVEEMKIMAEVSDPVNTWKLTKKVIEIKEDVRKATNSQGEIVEAPDPGMGLVRGDNGVYTTDASKKSKNGCIRIDSIPPKHSNKMVEPKENYLLSLHPELENANKSGMTDNDDEISNILFKKTLNGSSNSNNSDNVINNSVNNLKTVTSVNNTSVLHDNTITPPVNDTVTENQMIKHPELYINLDNSYENIIIVKDNVKHQFNINDFIDKLFAVKKVEKPAPEKPKQPEYNIKGEDELITNMIEKSKKVECTIGAEFVMNIPPKAVYDTIKMAYPDEMAQQFIYSLAERTSYDSLKNVLRAGLSGFYDDSTEEENK